MISSMLSMLVSPRVITPIGFLFFVVVVGCFVYLPGTHGPLLLDDKSSLLKLNALAISPNLAPDYIFGDDSGPLGRTVSMASFALEKIYLGDSSVTSKTVNVYLHILNGLLVFWLFVLLFRPYFVQKLYATAFLFASLWVFAPIHVSTVLYVVQRMAMLSTTFSLTALISYLYFRATPDFGVRQMLCLLAFFVSVGLAIFSKENAVVLLPLVVFLELLWFAGGVDRSIKSRYSNFTAKVVLGVGMTAALLILLLYYEWLSDSYAFRKFDLIERALTQTRVLWDYVRQTFDPDLTRLGLYHDDYIVSRSFLSPVSTLYASSAWLVVLGFMLAISRFRYGRWLAFSIVFYLVAHLTESTVWPLEIYFEHRNYFPSIGLVLLLAGAYAYFSDLWPQTASPLLCWLGIYLVVMIFQTTSQVQIWSSAPVLAMNHVNGHPESARANADMAAHLALAGDLDAALEYSGKVHVYSNKHMASSSESQGDREIRDIVLSCMARTPLRPEYTSNLGAHNLDRPFGSVQTFHTLVKLLQSNACPEFDRDGLSARLAELYLVVGSPASASPNMYSLLAGFENSRSNYRLAYLYTEKFLQQSPDDTRGLLMQLHFTTALGFRDEAESISANLIAKREAGSLTIREVETLALYLD
jgi:protein O-mannosyl-transferase